MANYLFKLLGLMIFALAIIFFYYLVNLDGVSIFIDGASSSFIHLESFNGGYLPYIFSIGIFYLVYKGIQVQLGAKKISFSLSQLFWFFLFNLFVLSVLFFYYSNGVLGQGLNLFLKIIFYSIIPILLIFISIAFGRKIIKSIFSKDFLEQQGDIFLFLISLGVGFSSFITAITLFGLFGFYNLYSVFSILLLFILFSYRELLELFSGFTNYRIEFSSHNLESDNIYDKVAFRLLTAEFLFIIASLVLSVNFINIIRPMPIGWDDLGVYMNYPRQIAYSSSLLSLGGMYAWQVFTAIGYMIGEPVQAFFLNNVGGILSFLLIILILSDLFKNKKNTFLSIPILLSTVFISMPMVIFQQAKDMKLDEGLFFISIIAVYLLYKMFVNQIYNNDLKHKDKHFSKDTIKLLFIIGILTGIAFSIKFTSLILISAILGVLFYVEAGIFGFLGYLSIYFAVFTKANLWQYMNVVVNPNNIVGFETNFFFGAMFLGGGLLGFGLHKHKKDIKKFISYIFVFLLGVIIAMLPWLAKNIYEGYPNISIGILLNGKGNFLNTNLENIYSKDELKKIEDNYNYTNMSDNGKSSNEDLGRYFGYENGVNNYIKLPWSLTMQINQGGEFTTIGFIFLALIPSILLFLPFKNKYYFLGVGILLVLELLLFAVPTTKAIFTSFLANFVLPQGYIIILATFLIPLLYFLFTIKNSRLTYLFKLNLVFSVFYTFLWTISAFGIVWYGIVMYFAFLFIIGVGLHYLSGYKDEDSNKDLFFKFFGAIVVFMVFLIWFLASVVPHAFNNLRDAQYDYYKTGQFTAEELIFAYHPEYLTMLVKLNIDDTKLKEFILSNSKNEKLNIIIKPYLDNIPVLDSLLKMLEAKNFEAIFGKDLLAKIDNNELLLLSNNAKELRLDIYKGILKPEEKFKNKENIYRIGTFMKYFISENNSRIYEDSLVTEFDKYMYNNDFDITVDRMKKLGLKYLLSDLNAATIDQDPRHDLTRRYDNLLKTFTSDKLKLVETDSPCLKFAIDLYKENKNIDEYMLVAGVNYESYDKEGSLAKNRNEKRLYCYQKMIETINIPNKVTKESFSYLYPIKQHISENQEKFQDEISVLYYFRDNVPVGSKVLFEIND